MTIKDQVAITSTHIYPQPDSRLVYVEGPLLAEELWGVWGSRFYLMEEKLRSRGAELGAWRHRIRAFGPAL
jgi:hypothetical protein